MDERGMAYWVTLTGAQIGAVEAWVAVQIGDQDAAWVAMEAAADAEDSFDKAPITPHRQRPLCEWWADIPGLLGDSERADTAYEAALVVSSNLSRALAGIERASGE